MLTSCLCIESVILVSNYDKTQEAKDFLTRFYLNLGKIGALHPTPDYAFCVCPPTNDNLKINKTVWSR